MIDRDRAAVYAAELAAFDGTDLEAVRDFDVIAASITRLTTADTWWPGVAVTARRARSDSLSSSTRCDVSAGATGEATIRLAASQLTVATAAHELAHALAGAAHGHDDVFRRAYLDVVLVITNVDSTDRRHALHVDQLANAFAASNLRVGPRQWPPPPASTGHAFAL